MIKVAFVANTPLLQGLGLGEEIDSYDIVYRTNMWPVLNEKDYGGKTNVISVLREYHDRARSYDVETLVFIDYDKKEDDGHVYMSREERKRCKNYLLNRYGIDVKWPTAGMLAWWLYRDYDFTYYGITGYQNDKKKVVNHSELDHYSQEYKQWSGNHNVERWKQADMNNYVFHDFEAQNRVMKMMLNDGLIKIHESSIKYFQ